MYQLGPGLWPLSSHQGGRAGNKKSDKISITVRLERGMTLRNFSSRTVAPFSVVWLFGSGPNFKSDLHARLPPSFRPSSHYLAVCRPAVLESEDSFLAHFTRARTCFPVLRGSYPVTV